MQDDILFRSTEIVILDREFNFFEMPFTEVSFRALSESSKLLMLSEGYSPAVNIPHEIYVSSNSDYDDDSPVGTGVYKLESELVCSICSIWVDLGPIFGCNQKGKALYPSKEFFFEPDLE